MSHGPDKEYEQLRVSGLHAFYGESRRHVPCMYVEHTHCPNSLALQLCQFASD